MNDGYTLSQIYRSDKSSNIQVNDLLAQEDIRRDDHLDYTCGLFDDAMNLVATGSCFNNTLRCLAVSRNHQGEALMNRIITHLTEVQFNRGNMHFFIYTKPSTANFFGSLGFYEIATVPNLLVFMENRRTGFSDYLKKLQKETSTQGFSVPGDSPLFSGFNAAAIVINANPFTLGHRYLVEQASAHCDVLHLFIVSEEASLVPFTIRKQLILEATSDLKNICYHDSGPYIISSGTFPSYFQKDTDEVVKSQAYLDLLIFTKIAESLHIKSRYVGDEPTSHVTNTYNQVMYRLLPQNDIRCHIIPRIETVIPKLTKDNSGITASSPDVSGKQVISASTVRKALQNDDWLTVAAMVPPTTLSFFKSDAAKPILERIKKEVDVVHH